MKDEFEQKIKLLEQFCIDNNIQLEASLIDGEYPTIEVNLLVDNSVIYYEAVGVTIN